MHEPQVGSSLGHYKILRRLGAGGMGVVFEAEDLKLGRHVALKLIAGSAASDPSALERFWREARTASALNHPGICTIYEINETESQPFLVMELLEGQSLDRLYGGQAVPVPRLIELGVQLADALDAAHRKGILHRDIKPANIFVTGSGQPKILDFGLARFDSSAATDSTDAGLPARDQLTSPGSTLGTIAYMSPEQARGEPLDARSDIFSLGVVLYEMATANHPFTGTTTAVVFDKLLNYLPPAPLSFNQELPAEFEHLLSKSLEKDRDLRYQSAADLRADLKRLQRSSSASRIMASAVTLPTSSSYPGMTRAGSAPPASPGKSAASSPPATAPAQRPEPQHVQSRSRAGLITAAALVLVIAAGVLTGIWLHARGKSAAVASVAANTPTPGAAATPSGSAVRSGPALAKPSAATPSAPAALPPTPSAHVRPSTASTAPTPFIPATPPVTGGTPSPPSTPAAKVPVASGTTYAARHMHLFGRSCTGVLQLTKTRLSYTSSVHSLNLARADVHAIDGNAVVQPDGKRWRFEIDGMTNAQVHDLLAHWYGTASSQINQH